MESPGEEGPRTTRVAHVVLAEFMHLSGGELPKLGPLHAAFVTPLAVDIQPHRAALRDAVAPVCGLHPPPTLLQGHCDPVPLLRSDQVVGVFCVLAEVDLNPVDSAVEPRAGAGIVVTDRRASVAAYIGLVV